MSKLYLSGEALKHYQNSCKHKNIYIEKGRGFTGGGGGEYIFFIHWCADCCKEIKAVQISEPWVSNKELIIENY